MDTFEEIKRVLKLKFKDYEKKYEKVLLFKYQGDNYYLIPPKWDCGWYWGFGYIQSYDRKGVKSHSHISSFDPTTLSQLLEKTGFKNSWLIAEYFRNFYYLKERSQLSYLGHHNITNNVPKEYLSTFRDSDDYKKVNSFLIPMVIESIYKELDNKNEEE